MTFEDLNAVIAHLGRAHARARLEAGDLDPDPLVVFAGWLHAALDAGVDLPNAMTLATADGRGRLSARTVLLKNVEKRGFVFFSDYESRKGRELQANPHAALVWHWVELERQVCVTGRVERLAAEESDAYFATRARGSQIAAWASRQSAVIPDRIELEEKVAVLEARYAGAEIPRPEFWGGYLLVPEQIEFWQAQPNRLHDRIRYTRSAEGWRIERLAP